MTVEYFVYVDGHCVTQTTKLKDAQRLFDYWRSRNVQVKLLKQIVTTRLEQIAYHDPDQLEMKFSDDSTQ